MKLIVSGAYPKNYSKKYKEGFRYGEAYINLLDWESLPNMRELGEHHQR